MDETLYVVPSEIRNGAVRSVYGTMRPYNEERHAAGEELAEKGKKDPKAKPAHVKEIYHQ